MLKIASLEQDIFTESTIPEVFIDLIYVEDDIVEAIFHLEDVSGEWINDTDVLNSLNVNIVYDGSTYSESLASLKQRSVVKNNIIKSNIKLTRKNLTTSIEAYCGNDYLTGTKTTEPVLLEGNVVPSSYNNNSYQYVNKIIDLRLLKINSILENITAQQLEPKLNNHISNVFISYTTNKHASISCTLALDTFLQQRSAIYRFFEKYDLYKQSILSKSYIKTNEVLFYKKNISTEYSEYEGVKSQINSVRIDDSGYTYLLSCADTSADIHNRNKYRLKVKIPVYDYSYDFFKLNVSNTLENSKQYISTYISKLESCKNNNIIADWRTFFFENEYEKEQSNISAIIENLSSIFSFYQNKSKQVFYSLFLNLFHPLITDTQILFYLLNEIDKLQNIVFQILEIINIDGQPKGLYTAEYELQAEKEFSQNLEEILDFDYEPNFGYEVISSDNFDVRSQETISKIKTISLVEEANRSLLESNKYATPYLITSDHTSFLNSTLTFSSIDFGSNSYYLLQNLNNLQIDVFNDVFFNIKQRKSNIQVRRPEAYYFGLLYENNLYIKTLDTRKNNVNSLELTTLFDPNLESQQQSLEFITSTGIDSLYYSLNKDAFLSVDSQIKSINISSSSGVTITNLNASDQISKTPSIKPKMIISYNNIFKIRTIIEGQNYGLYDSYPIIFNPLFDSLRHFNKYYLVKFKDNVSTVITPQEQLTEEFMNELNYNIPTKYLNRVVTDSTINITLE